MGCCRISSWHEEILKPLFKRSVSEAAPAIYRVEIIKREEAQVRYQKLKVVLTVKLIGLVRHIEK